MSTADRTSTPVSLSLTHFPSISPKTSQTSESRKSKRYSTLYPQGILQGANVAIPSLNWRSRLDQAVKLAIHLNNELESSATQPNEEKQEVSLDLSTRCRNLKVLSPTSTIECKKLRGIIHQSGSFLRSGQRVKNFIDQSKIIELMSMVAKDSISEEQFRIEFKKFKRCLIDSLADISPLREELSRITLPKEIGCNKESLLCKELRNVIERAKSLQKIWVQFSQGMDFFKYSLGRSKDGEGVSKLCVKVSVTFFKFQHPDAAASEERTRLMAVPKRIDLRLLWGKRNEEKLPKLLEGMRNVRCFLHEAEGGFAAEKILHNLVLDEVVANLKKIDDLKLKLNNASENKLEIEQELLAKQLVLNYFKILCGQAILDEGKRKIADEADLNELVSSARELKFPLIIDDDKSEKAKEKQPLVDESSETSAEVKKVVVPPLKIKDQS